MTSSSAAAALIRQFERNTWSVSRQRGKAACAEASILSANVLAPVGRGKNSVSLDQFMAKHLGSHTRFPSLVLSSSGSNSPSYTEQGAMIPAESSPSQLYMQLFVDGAPIADRVTLSDPVGANSELYVIQALSGG